MLERGTWQTSEQQRRETADHDNPTHRAVDLGQLGHHLARLAQRQLESTVTAGHIHPENTQPLQLVQDVGRHAPGGLDLPGP